MSGKKPVEVGWRRKSLPRNSKNLRLMLRPKHYAKLVQLTRTDRIGRQEPIVAVVERLIEQAELLRPASLDVHLPPRAA